MSFESKSTFNESTSFNFTCFECCKLGHIKSKCSIFLKKKQGGENKVNVHNNKKKAYIAWEENASSTSSDSTNKEEYLYLMAIGEVESFVGSSDSKIELDENYDKLLHAFNEMHEEAKKLSQANNYLKGKLR